jgi:hypothetical protein
MLSIGCESTEMSELLDLPLFSSRFTYETNTLLNVVDLIQDQIKYACYLGASGM